MYVPAEIYTKKISYVPITAAVQFGSVSIHKNTQLWLLCIISLKSDFETSYHNHFTTFRPKREFMLWSIFVDFTVCNLDTSFYCHGIITFSICATAICRTWNQSISHQYLIVPIIKILLITKSAIMDSRRFIMAILCAIYCKRM